MKKHHVHTTISPKHMALLEKHSVKFETKQKVLEYALECMDKNHSQSSTPLSPEEEIWMQLGRETKTICLVHKDVMKEFLRTVDLDRIKVLITTTQPVKYNIEYSLQKPLGECSLKEVIDGAILSAKVSRWFDTLNCTEAEDSYTLVFTHDMGLINSKIVQMLFENVFAIYGARTETTVSEMTFIQKIYKQTRQEA